MEKTPEIRRVFVSKCDGSLKLQHNELIIFYTGRNLLVNHINKLKLDAPKNKQQNIHIR